MYWRQSHKLTWCFTFVFKHFYIWDNVSTQTNKIYNIVLLVLGYVDPKMVHSVPLHDPFGRLWIMVTFKIKSTFKTKIVVHKAKDQWT